jgi:mono/diheme cytochrome c family protein
LVTRGLRVGAGAALFCALLAACGGGKGSDAQSGAAQGGGSAGGATADASSSSESDSPGRTLYRAACVMCHGERGAGTFIGGALNDHARDVAAVEQAVRDGVAEVKEPSHTPMPPRGDGAWTDAQIRTVAEYVHSLGSK